MAAWAVFFLWLYTVAQPTLARLLHPRLWWLVLAGALVLLLFCGVALRRFKQPAAQPLRWSWPAYLILLVPLCYAGQMQSARFNSQTFFDRSAATIESTETVQDEQSRQRATEPSAIPATAGPPAEVSFSQIVQDPKHYAGQTVEVLCQALADPRLPEDQLICYRFRITCCAADAQPVFVFVNRRNFPLPAQDAWLRVRGTLSAHTVGGITFPLIHALHLQQEQEPSFPFVF